jgi:hypothetical protein
MGFACFMHFAFFSMFVLYVGHIFVAF